MTEHRVTAGGRRNTPPLLPRRRGPGTSCGPTTRLDSTPGEDRRSPAGPGLDALARSARRKLDDAGLLGARVMASGGLDEYAVARLVATGAPIGAFGVGTKVGVSADAPSLDSTYKLVDYSGRPVMKLSTGKVTAPAAKQVYRGVAGEPDILALRDEPAPAGREPMLVPVMRAGGRLAEVEPLTATRHRFEQDLAWLPGRTRALTEPVPVSVHPTVALTALRDRLGRALQAL